MFGKKTTKKSTPTSNSISTLAVGTFIDGDLTCDGTLVIEGNFFGTVKGCQKLVIGENGTVNGTVDVNNAMVFGGVDGEVKVKELLHIQSSGKIIGNSLVNPLGVSESSTVEIRESIADRGRGKPENLKRAIMS